MRTTMNCSPQYLRREAAAAYLLNRYGFTTAKTLSKLASAGGGPAFSKAGKLVVYKIEDLDRWAESKIRSVQPAASISA